MEVAIFLYDLANLTYQATPPNEHPPTAKCLSEKSTTCDVLDREMYQL